jgi:hypothetical protein
MSKVFIEAFAVGIEIKSGVRFENIPCRGQDGIVQISRSRAAKRKFGWLNESPQPEVRAEAILGEE